MEKKLFFIVIVANLLIFSIPNYSGTASNFNTSLIVGYCTGSYFNNTISTVANTTTTINATPTSNLSITMNLFTTSNVTNSSISVIQYNSTPPNTTSIGIQGLNEFFEISLGSYLNSSFGWALLNISYNETEVANAGLSENSLRVYRYNTSSGSWSVVASSGVNTVNNYVWANLTSFSYYGIGGSLLCGNGICDTGETNSNCPSDCPSSVAAPGGGGLFIEGKCTYEWQCTGWSECVNGVQTRYCSNVGSCKDNKGKPAESQSCVSPPTPTNVTPSIPTSIPTPVTTSTSTPTPTTPLGLGIGLIAVTAVSAALIFVILKRKKLKRKILGGANE